MRVAHLLRPARGGMLRQVRSLLMDPEVESVLAAPPSELARLSPVLREPGYPLPESDALRVQIRAGIALGRWVRQGKRDLLHGHGLKRLPLYVVAAKLARLPLVLTLHNLFPARASEVVRALLRQATRVIAVSEAVARTARVRATVIYNGIDLTPFAALPTREEARARLGWSADRVVLCVARLSPEKGLDTLLQATEGRALRVLIAGEGPERRVLEARGGATLLGERDDIPLLMAAADLYCQPSREEGLGLAVIEAMAAGLPIIASRVGGIPELLPEERCGILVPPDDAGALGAALKALGDDRARREAMGDAARTRAREHFGEIEMRRRTRALYESIEKPPQ